MGTSLSNETDYLGYGYDVTKRYCHPEGICFGGDIIDIQKLKETEPSRYKFVTIGTQSADLKRIYGVNVDNYYSQLSGEFKIAGGYKAFAGAISSKFDHTNKCSSEYSFGSVFSIIRKAYVFLKADIDTLQKYLHKDFLTDVKNSSCEYLIDNYGTHLMTHITLGGRLEVLCRSIIEGKDKADIIEAGVKASYGKFVDASASGSYDEKLAKKNQKLQVNIETVGGEPSKSISKTFDFNTTNSNIDFESWSSSINASNMTLVEIDPNSLVSIVDLIPNDAVYAVKKKELAAAIDTYLSEHQVTMIEKSKLKPVPKPLYRYFNHQTRDLFFTMNAHELGRGGGGANYTFERIECMLYETYIEGTIPLYRYFSNKHHDHVYTTNWNDYQSGSVDYTLENICGYVFASANGDTDRKLVPLYKCVIDPTGNMDHFYSRDPKEVVERRPDIQPPHIECYVYIPTEHEVVEAQQAIGIHG